MTVSFAIKAMGSRDEVVAQVNAAQVDIALGEEIKELLARHLQTAAAEDTYDHGYLVRYLVEASGHSGAGQLCSFSVKCEAHYVPAPKTELPAE